jgi:hypothetical protein
VCLNIFSRLLFAVPLDDELASGKWRQRQQQQQRQMPFAPFLNPAGGGAQWASSWHGLVVAAEARVLARPPARVHINSFCSRFPIKV